MNRQNRISRKLTISNPIETVTGFYLIDAAVGGNWQAWWDALRDMIWPVFVLATYPMSSSIWWLTSPKQA